MQFGKSGTMAGALASLIMPVVAEGQDRLNQADPSVIERTLPQPVPVKAPDDAGMAPTTQADTRPLPLAAPRIANAIVIDGAAIIPRQAFSDVLLPFIGRNLSNVDLAQLLRAVADVARQRAYPFASALIEPQNMTDGILRVRIDAGTIAAVRVIGEINPVADRTLTRALVTGEPVRSLQLQRAILLVGDLPGVTVKESKFLRQDGFGILLVTVSEDRLSAYAQIDNRGSREVGPVRSTILANARGVFGAGDEFGVILAQTPLEPSEFGFIRARYNAPLNDNGAILSASASYGRTHPGASLAQLDVIGQSYDAAVNFRMPLERTRPRSVWAELEFRGLRTRQTLLGTTLRNDRLATLTASINTELQAAGGSFRAELRATAGLPFQGVTHEGAPRSSRSDGDARFVTFGYDADWTRPMAKRWSVALASEGQLASRPLLAATEIGAGGPLFGRGYDYAERTGDDGLLGSAEVRYDAGRIPDVLDRLQVYGSVDGGYVDNLRGGRGGGALLSTGIGLRVSRGRLGGTVEAGIPLNKDRFDTGNQDPRISFRLSRVF